jgi:tetratricopeptide (TPR) repeat protein
MSEKFPKDELIQFSLGQKYYDLNDMENAKNILLKANELNEKHLLTKLLLGRIFSGEGNEKKARIFFERGLELIKVLPPGSGQELEEDFHSELRELDEEEKF